VAIQPMVSDGRMADMETFLGKLSEEYPVLLAAETLVLLTLGTLGYLLRRFAMPLAERYLEWYREKKLRSLSASIEYLDTLIKDNQDRTRSLFFAGCYWIFYTVLLTRAANM
jgi:hypothetical protein